MIDHQHHDHWADLHLTTHKRVTHYFEICDCGFVRLCAWKRPVEDWRDPSRVGYRGKTLIRNAQ